MYMHTYTYICMITNHMHINCEACDTCFLDTLDWQIKIWYAGLDSPRAI